MSRDEYARSRVGQTVGKYTLERLIGEGGMAAVYEGVHRSNGDRVAIKMLHPEAGASDDIRKKFLREGYVANKVKHRGAVRVIDDDTASDGAVFIVMELLEGKTVDAKWKEHHCRLPAREVLDLAAQLLDVLASAHANGVIHRDLKPENLIVTNEGTLKVLDFGIARLREPDKSVTQSGRMMGTPAFLPPEQALGRADEIDGRTDLWATGATMFALISGKFVHEGGTVEEVFVKSATEKARSLATVAPDAHPAIVAVVDRALAFDKAARWPDATAMKAAVIDAAAAMSTGTVALGYPSAPSALAATVPAPIASSPTPVASSPTPVASSAPEGMIEVARTLGPSVTSQQTTAKRRSSRTPLVAGGAIAFVALAVVLAMNASSRHEGNATTSPITTPTTTAASTPTPTSTPTSTPASTPASTPTSTPTSAPTSTPTPSSSPSKPAVGSPTSKASAKPRASGSASAVRPDPLAGQQ